MRTSLILFSWESHIFHANSRHHHCLKQYHGIGLRTTRLVVHEVKTNILHISIRHTTVFHYSLQFSIVIEIKYPSHKFIIDIIFIINQSQYIILIIKKNLNDELQKNHLHFTLQIMKFTITILIVTKYKNFNP